MRRNTFPVVAAAGLIWMTIGLTYVFMDARYQSGKTAANPQPGVAAGTAPRNGSNWRNLVQGAKTAVSRFVKPRPTPTATPTNAETDLDEK
ncbi:MAG TPA: hypothetical protein VE988_24435 [Gemmataceae bacterium]|nr:hypothetical protein [Gemmataceae bacterium]